MKLINWITVLFIFLSIDGLGQTLYQTNLDIKFREGPGKKFNSLGIIKKGVVINVIDSSVNAWFKIEYEGQTGFVLKKFATIYNPVVIPEVQPVVVPDRISKTSATPTILISLAVIALASIYVRRELKKKKVGEKRESSHSNTTNVNEAVDLTSIRGSITQVFDTIPATIESNAISSRSDNFPRENVLQNQASSFPDLPRSNLDGESVAPSKEVTSFQPMEFATPNCLKENAKAEKVSEDNESIESGNNIIGLENDLQGSKLKPDQDALVDDSIIDVTDQSVKLETAQIKLTKYEPGVPYWEHTYVYSSAVLSSATKPQKDFYDLFKAKFLQGVYLDTENISNYSFVLLFDLLAAYTSASQFQIVKSQIETLAELYPKIDRYGFSFLKSKAVQLSDSHALASLDLRQLASTTYAAYNRDNSFDHDNWGLGKRYKADLELTDEEVKLLNNLWYSNNTFSSIEYCCHQLIRLYLGVIKELDQSYQAERSNFNTELQQLIGVVLKKHFKYQETNYNYTSSIESVRREVYCNIFKRCENALRGYYGHKRKINLDSYLTSSPLLDDQEIRLFSKAETVLSKVLQQIPKPNEATEVELNKQNTARWKIRFEELVANYNSNADDFLNQICLLGKLNRKNPSIENIFFEASKFIAKYNKEDSLTLYIHYVYHDLKSASFDNKQLTKTIQKSLFTSNEQLREFEIIISELVKEKNLENALLAAPKIYAAKRKKIRLDTNSIREVQQQHSGTVQLLNEYLKDDYEDDISIIKAQEINENEIGLDITNKTAPEHSSPYLPELRFTTLQSELIALFSKSNFQMADEEITLFAKTNSAFKDQLIDSVNEICYEKLDDILIDIEEGIYLMNEDYYQTLLK